MILEPIPLEGNGARPSHFGSGYRDGGCDVFFEYY